MLEDECVCRMCVNMLQGECYVNYMKRFNLISRAVNWLLDEMIKDLGVINGIRVK